jgi:helix-turn-helix protein
MKNLKGLLVEMEVGGKKRKFAVVKVDEIKKMLTLENVITKSKFDMTYEAFEGFCDVELDKRELLQG